MKKSLWILVTSAVLAAPVYAQTPTVSDASLHELRKIMLSDEQVRQNNSAMVSSLQQWLDQSMEQAVANNPDLSPEQQSALQAVFKEFMREEVLGAVEDPAWNQEAIAVWMEAVKQHYTQKEVDALIAFYSSTEGRSILEKQPLMINDYMQRLQPIVQKRTGALQQKVRTKLREKVDRIMQSPNRRPR